MNSAPKFASEIHEVDDAAEANELFQRRGWTDGLPVVPPTEEAVARFLATTGLDAGAVIGVEPVRRRSITAEKVAIAAVMAGCLPEYLPVVLAAVECITDPAMPITTTQSTGSASLLTIGVNLVVDWLLSIYSRPQGENA